MRFTTIACIAATAIISTASARGGLLTSFDAYSASTALHNVDNWTAWNNIAANAGVVSTDRAFSGANSIRIRGYTDAVQNYTGATSGAWSISAKQYIASGQTGLTYFIIMNNYIPNANTNAAQWSTQLRFDLAAGTVRDDFRGGSASIITNQWVDVRVDIDLDNNRVSHFYNGVLLSSGTWTTGASSLRQINALDLYTKDSNTTYYDDIIMAQVVPTPGAAAMAFSACALCGLPRRKPAR